MASPRVSIQVDAEVHQKMMQAKGDLSFSNYFRKMVRMPQKRMGRPKKEPPKKK